MANLLTQKVGSFSFSPMDAVFVAGSKIVTENLLARIPLVGNGTLRSGLIKLGLAFALTGFGRRNKVMSIIGTGLMVDGGEDLVTSLLGARLGAQQQLTAIGGQNSNQGVGTGVVL